MDRINHLKEKLAKRGWQANEIDSAAAMLHTAEHVKEDHVRFLDSALYWIILLVAVLANFIISIALLPFLLVLTGWYLVGSLVLIGVAFGTMLDVIIRESEHLQKKHYVVAEIFIPAIALINIYIMTNLSKTLAAAMELPGVANDPIFVAIVYVVAFIAPHVAFGLIHKRSHHHLSAA